MEMDLDQMKEVWQDFSTQLDEQKRVTEALVLEMIAQKSASRFNRMVYAEGLGIILSGLMCLYILLHFHELEFLPNQLSAIGTILVMLLSIVFGYRIISAIRSINIIGDTYSTTASKFKRFKKIMGTYKRVSIGIYVVLPLIMLPVVTKLLGGKDLFNDTAAYGYAYLASLILLPIVWYIIFRFYRNNVRKVNTYIQKLDHDE